MWYNLPNTLLDIFYHSGIILLSICVGRCVALLMLSEKPVSDIWQHCRRFYNGMIEKGRVVIYRSSNVPSHDFNNGNKVQVTKLSFEYNIDMIAMRKWKDVLVWIVFHPNELLYCMDIRNHTTILHHVILFRAPAQIIHMLLYQQPTLAQIQNIDHELPLHWAVRLSLPNEIIKLLLSVYPSSACVIKDKDGNTPLSMVWERCEASLFDTWWRSSGCCTSILQNDIGWSNILFYLQCYSYSVNVVHDNNDNSSYTLLGDDDEDTDNNAHLIRIEEHGMIFLPFHAATQCPSCPLMMYTLLLQVYKNQIQQEDHYGRLPLTLACLNPISNRSIGALTKVHLLLTEYPVAAQKMDGQGLLPLFAALRSSMTWKEGIDSLIAVYPRSLLLCDPVTNLPAFLSAAVQSNSISQHSNSYSENPKLKGRDQNNLVSRSSSSSCEKQDYWDEAYLTTIYLLLRKDPAQIYVATTSICINR